MGVCQLAVAQEAIFSWVGSRRGPPDFVRFAGTATADYDVELNVMALALAITAKARVVLKLPASCVY